MDTENKLRRVIFIAAQLKLMKEFYAEYDALVCELQKGGFTCADLEGMRLELVDNFADGKNTVFRPAGVKRFEIELDTIEAAERKAAKREKKRTS